MPTVKPHPNYSQLQLTPPRSSHTMATHTVRLHKAQYDMAEDLARSGHSAEAIDICWRLRADPALSLWNKALVNLLLVTELNVEDYPDAAKFANEAIDLSHEVTRRTLALALGNSTCDISKNLSATVAFTLVSLELTSLTGATEPATKYEMIRVRRHVQGVLGVINQNLELVRAERQAETQAEKDARTKPSGYTRSVYITTKDEARSSEDVAAEKPALRGEKGEVP